MFIPRIDWHPIVPQAGRLQRPRVVPWDCHVLACQNRYAAGSVQFSTRRTCLESCCTACISGDNRCACIVLSPQRQAPLHVGNIWRGQRSTACITHCSFSLPLRLTDCHDHGGGQLRSFTDDRSSHSVRNSGCPNRLPRRRLLLSFENHSKRSPPIAVARSFGRPLFLIPPDWRGFSIGTCFTLCIAGFSAACLTRLQLSQDTGHVLLPLGA